MCERCGGSTKGQNVLGNNHRHSTDCIAFLKQNGPPIKGVPDRMRVKEIMHLQTEASTGIVYGQVIMEKDIQQLAPNLCRMNEAGDFLRPIVETAKAHYDALDEPYPAHLQSAIKFLLSEDE